MPWAGTTRGPQAFHDNLGNMFTRWERQSAVRHGGCPRRNAGHRQRLRQIIPFVSLPKTPAAAHCQAR
jgi:hypothetical protein